MAEKSVGLIELSSIAAGFQVADTMLKAGNVRLILVALDLLRQIHGAHRRRHRRR